MLRERSLTGVIDASVMNQRMRAAVSRRLNRVFPLGSLWGIWEIAIVRALYHLNMLTTIIAFHLVYGVGRHHWVSRGQEWPSVSGQLGVQEE